MREKTRTYAKRGAAVAAVAAVAALVASTPVVAEAGKMITGKQIKNGTVTSSDVKNRSLRAKDFRKGQLPRGEQGPSGTVQVQRFAGAVPDDLASGPLRFVGPTASVSVDGSQVVLGGGTVSVTADAEGDDADVALCVRPAGVPDEPTPLGGAVSWGIDLDDGENVLPAFGSDLLEAGTYDVGMCLRP